MDAVACMTLLAAGTAAVDDPSRCHISSPIPASAAAGLLWHVPVRGPARMCSAASGMVAGSGAFPAIAAGVSVALAGRT
jgi:hypothetical protein